MKSKYVLIMFSSRSRVKSERENEKDQMKIAVKMIRFVVTIRSYDRQYTTWNRKIIVSVNEGSSWGQIPYKLW